MRPGIRWTTVAFTLYGLSLGVGSLITLGIPGGIGHYDKLLHFLAYTTFALLAYAVTGVGWKFALLCLAIVVYGTALEWLQSLTVVRTMSVADALTNTAGVVAVFAGLTAMRRRGH